MVARFCAVAGSRAGIGWPSNPLARLNSQSALDGYVCAMQKRHRLGSQKRISEIHRRGRSAANGLLVVRLLPNNLDHNRYCFVAGKRVGKAVVRNKVKRRLREMIRNADTAPGWDTILIARRGAGEADFNRLRTATHSLIRRTPLGGPRDDSSQKPSHPDGTA